MESSWYLVGRLIKRISYKEAVDEVYEPTKLNQENNSSADKVRTEQGKKSKERMKRISRKINNNEST